MDICRSDQRADIFSYGVVAWELITQEHLRQRGVLRDFQVNTQWHLTSQVCCCTCLTALPTTSQTDEHHVHDEYHAKQAQYCRRSVQKLYDGYHQNGCIECTRTNMSFKRYTGEGGYVGISAQAFCIPMLCGCKGVWFNQVFVLVLQIPQECPQAVSDMVFACLSGNPGHRPTAQEIIQVIECSMADNSA